MDDSVGELKMSIEYACEFVDSRWVLEGPEGGTCWKEPSRYDVCRAELESVDENPLSDLNVLYQVSKAT